MSKYTNYGRLGGFSLFPPVLKGLIIANIAVYIIQHLILEILTFQGISLSNIFLRYFALWPIDFGDLFSSSLYSFYPWQIISYQFMHANFWHLFMNLFALWMFGSELENLWGSKKFLYYYIISGIGAAIIHLIVTPMIGSDLRPTVGASGAVYGILLAFAFTFPNRPIFMFPLFIPIPAKFFVLIFAIIELFSGFSGNSGIAHFAHLGGALTGFLMLKFGKNLPFLKDYPTNTYSNDIFSYYNSNKEEPRVQRFRVSWTVKSKDEDKITYYNEPKSQNTKTFIVDGEIIPQSTIDYLLDKISSKGFQSLTEKEKYILTEISKQI